MAESITISRKEPALRSMQYSFLREQGIQHIQRMAGKLWTNFNSSDPGLTILEALSYAITELGYRSSYEVKDLIAQDPSDPASADIRNFFTAAQILPNAPVTYNDYRKLIMDVDVHDVDGESLGVKNAWIEIARSAEQAIYPHSAKSKLDYTIDPLAVREPGKRDPISFDTLYNILIELGTSEKYGDLNENTLEGSISIYPCTGYFLDSRLIGSRVQLEVQFPRWDEKIDWSSAQEVIRNIKSVVISLSGLPGGFRAGAYGLDPVSKEVYLSITNLDTEIDTTCIQHLANQYISNSLVKIYQEKVEKILRIIDKVKSTLAANRNLCEDFLRINALKVEEIAMCAEIELDTEADVEETQALIFHTISKFLSPQVYFYSLEEMFGKGKASEEIFEGPKLAHGFIDDEELKKADRRQSIHVSDLISLIMDIKGVLAVKSIQVANIPLDNDDKIPEVSVKWCLSLAVQHNYVPRLSIDRSKLSFFKGQLPYRANEEEVDRLIRDLENKERQPKMHSWNLDIEVPGGIYKSIDDYTSIQEEFPAVYGIGSEGLPLTASTERKAHARQLKGFLMFFDQLLAGYVSQLAHIKDLFSMNNERDEEGSFKIGRSYFTRNLLDIVPDAEALIRDPDDHERHLEGITETIDQYEKRRNRFLDHLMARFSEQFTDYALLSYRLSGSKTPEELMEDKLALLNAYPEISSGRFLAMDYYNRCGLWHRDNVPGLKKRVSMLAGIDAVTTEHLAFSDRFRTYDTSDGFGFVIRDINGNIILENPEIYKTEAEAKLALEAAVMNGVAAENFKLMKPTGEIITDTGSDIFHTDIFALMCGDTILARAEIRNIGAGPVIDFFNDPSQLVSVFEEEYYNNPLSNRNNLSSPVDLYVQYGIVDHYSESENAYVHNLRYEFFNKPFSTDFNDSIISGTIPIAELPDDAVKRKEKIRQELFKLAYTATDTGNYSFRTSSGDHVFDIVDRGTVIGTSVETNFNEQIRQALAPSRIIQLEGSTGNDGAYTIMNASLLGQNIELQLEEDLPGPVPDGSLVLTENNPVERVEKARRSFVIAGDVSRMLFPGESIVLTQTDDDDNNGTYTVKKVSFDGAESIIKVEEKIPVASDTGMLSFTRRMPVVIAQPDGIPNIIVVKPGADDRAAAETAAFMREKFFSTEGLHILEHILLRPKANGTFKKLLAPMELSPARYPGVLRFTCSERVISATINTFLLPRGWKNEFYPGKKVRIDGSDGNDNEYTVIGVTETDFGTSVKVNTTISLQKGNLGRMLFENTRVEPVASVTDDSISIMGDWAGPIAQNGVITAYNASGVKTIYRVIETAFLKDRTRIIIEEAIAKSNTPVSVYFETFGAIDFYGKSNDVFIKALSREYVSEKDTVTITGSDRHNGEYIIGKVSEGSIMLTHKLAHVQDTLLPIDLQAECAECRLTDPYSHIATVVVPFWPGRFLSSDFRRFFERTLHLEAPAHVLLNICWISPANMMEFETTWKKWLLENSRAKKDQPAVSKALDELIAALQKMRNVYPAGTLHDCDEDPGMRSSIILNNSILGNI